MIFIYPKLLCILEFYDRRGSPPRMGKLVKTTALKSNKEKEAAGEEEWKGGRNNTNMIKWLAWFQQRVYTSDSGSLSSPKAQASS